MKLQLTSTRVGLAILAACLFHTIVPALAQEKKILLEKEYALWGKMHLYAASDDARWVAYGVRYESGTDTLTLEHTQKNKQYRYPQGISVLFGGSRFAAVHQSNGSVNVRQLENGSQATYEKVSSFGFNAGASHLFLLQQDGLLVIALKTNEKHLIPFVTSFSYNAAANILAYTTGGSGPNGVALLRFSAKKGMEITPVANSPHSTYTNLAWASGGLEIAFEEHPGALSLTNSKTKIGIYYIKDKAFFEFDPDRFTGFPKGKLISCTYLKPLSVSDDGSKVFFGIAGNNPSEAGDTESVQIWNTADKFIYPNKEEIRGWTVVAKVAVWWPRTGRFFTPPHDYPTAMLTGDQNAMLTYDPLQYEPQNDFNAPVDIKLTILETAEKRLILEKWPFSPGQLQISPAGKLILYWKDGNWWGYDIKADRHRNLTYALPESFSDLGYDRPSAQPPFGLAGWSADDKVVFLYGLNDIWEIATDGSGYRRITNSAGIGSQSRFAIERSKRGNLDGSTPVIIDTRSKLIIKERASTSTALYSWAGGKELQMIIREPGEIRDIMPDKACENWIYTFHNYQTPPLIRFVGAKKMAKSIYESNQHQVMFYWGKAVMIDYTDASGKALKGILYYPADYSQKQLYPMVVHIYEKQSGSFFDYIYPSLYNDTGFNITNLLSKGYFVLLPDIVYRRGQPGRSALECTQAAVKKALNTASVDPGRVGLIGHSWGGYETDYIISKTPIFKAAVAGAAITDLTSNYFTVAWNNYIPNFYQSEFDQVRLGEGFYTNPNLYSENSPLFNAEGITTPLLSWAGNEDKQVSTSQTIALHLALRRLGKKNIMLLYPGERHVLLQNEHQSDLTRRTEAWFAHYLKGESEPAWLKEDILK